MNLYEKVCEFDNLFLAYRKARKGKSRKWYVKEFDKDVEKNLLKLESDLRHDKYRPRLMEVFVIRDPKTRVISASDFRDRVVHHAICNIIEPMFDKSFIYDSYASRRGKGTHSAIKRFDYFKRKVSCNGRLLNHGKDGNMVIGYVLKADIKHYFDTVDHEILLKVLRKKVADERLMNLIKIIIENHNTKNIGKGMPIGNLTSQIFANVYLNELDIFIKHKLRAKYYIRYIDDFVILHKNKNVLELWKREISEFLKRELKLELHPEKTKIYALHHGVNFLGFRILYRYKLLKRSNISLIKHKIRDYIEQYKLGHMEKDEIKERIEGWSAYAMRANTFRLRREILRKMSSDMCK